MTIKDNERHSRIKLFFKLAVIVLVFSFILAFPMVKITLTWSMDTSWRLYSELTRVLHLHSPAVVTIDEDGIPIVDVGYQKGQYVGSQRNPLTIATQSILYYEQFSRDGKAKEKEYFINCIDWLEHKCINRGNYALWAYDFALPTYNASSPWYSAMAQTRIMIAFERAYELTGDDKYMELSLMAMRSLQVPIDHGGVLYIDPEDGGKWYEEVSGGGSIPAHILNGFIACLFDLNDFFIRTDFQEAKSLFDDGIYELKLHLNDYDTGRWTYYDRDGHLAYDYHYVHIDQMAQLYEITGDAQFKTFHDQWESYFPINPMWARRRFAAYLLDVALIFIILISIIIIYNIYRKSDWRNKLHQWGKTS